jgi:hypothetical protein
VEQVDSLKPSTDCAEIGVWLLSGTAGRFTPDSNCALVALSIATCPLQSALL